MLMERVIPGLSPCFFAVTLGNFCLVVAKEFFKGDKGPPGRPGNAGTKGSKGALWTHSES